jgi:RimJ/RimL family protein N-acetyltransferase
MTQEKSPQSGFEFRAVTADDIPLLHHWLGQPHVTHWWGPAPTLDAVREDYLHRLAPQQLLPLDAPAGVTQYIAYEHGEAFGFIQAYRVMAGQSEGFWTEQCDPFALGIDQFIGLPDKLGKGIGTRMVRAFVAWLFEDPRVTSVQTDPSPDNSRAIAAYEKAGFVEVELVETPDGAALLMRIDAPKVSEAPGTRLTDLSHG